MGDKDYLSELIAEKDNVDSKCSNSLRLLNQEIERVQSGGKKQKEQPIQQAKYIDVSKKKPIKLTAKILVPVKEHPQFNFVGKIIGPKGSSLQRLKDETRSKIVILGKGSIRDKQKEEELRNGSDPKYSHLNDDLHVHIEVYSNPSDAHTRVAHAIAEVEKLLIPEYENEEDQRNWMAWNNKSYDNYESAYDPYESSYPSSGVDSHYYEYGRGVDSVDPYDDGYGESTWAVSQSRYKTPARSKPSYRDHPYPYGSMRSSY